MDEIIYLLGVSVLLDKQKDVYLKRRTTQKGVKFFFFDELWSLTFTKKEMDKQQGYQFLAG